MQSIFVEQKRLQVALKYILHCFQAPTENTMTLSAISFLSPIRELDQLKRV